MRGRPLSEEDRAIAIRMRQGGYTYKLIAARLSRPLGTISTVLSLAIFDKTMPYVKEIAPEVRRKRRFY